MGAELKFRKNKKKPVRPVHSNFRQSYSGKAAFLSAQLETRTGRFPVLAGIFSAIFHLALFSGLGVYATMPKPAPQKITVRIVPKPKPVVAEQKKEEVPPPKPEPKKQPPKKEQKVTSERKPKQNPVKPPPPVQGLAPDALSPDGKGIAVPVGNTLMTSDEGKRLDPKDVQPLGNVDLSADPKLIRTSIVTPTYTEMAIDSSLEGTFVVDVFVDAKGSVSSAELAKKIGMGMDAKVLAAARSARFEPRKDRFGKSVTGWTTISFRLELP